MRSRSTCVTRAGQGAASAGALAQAKLPACGDSNSKSSWPVPRLTQRRARRATGRHLLPNGVWDLHTSFAKLSVLFKHKSVGATLGSNRRGNNNNYTLNFHVWHKRPPIRFSIPHNKRTEPSVDEKPCSQARTSYETLEIQRALKLIGAETSRWTHKHRPVRSPLSLTR